MHTITKRLKLADHTHMVSVHCPEIAPKIKPGQFVLLRCSEDHERLQFDYHGGNRKEINIVFEESESMKPLLGLKKGHHIYELVGPLGMPTELNSFNTICLVGKGSGIATIYTLSQTLKNKNNRVIALLGAKTKKGLFWEDKFDKLADHVFVSTEDGSKGRKGTLDLALKDILKKRIDLIYVAADNPTASQISKMTKHYVKTIARVHVKMLDGFGMCGCDRIRYDNQVRLCSVDGPDFDAHKVDWDSVFIREDPFFDKSLIYRGR